MPAQDLGLSPGGDTGYQGSQISSELVPITLQIAVHLGLGDPVRHRHVDTKLGIDFPDPRFDLVDFQLEANVLEDRFCNRWGIGDQGADPGSQFRVGVSQEVPYLRLSYVVPQ